MRTKQIQSIVNDLLELRCWRNPLLAVTLNKKIEFDLIKNKISNHEGSDSLTELLKEKREWFKQRVKDLNGNLKDFKEAKIIVFGTKEKVKIIYKDEEFVNEKIW